MRYLILLFASVALALSFSGCKKEEAGESVSLIGNWELRHTSGGMMPPTSYPPGNGQIIRFETDHLQYIRGGQVIFQGNYQLVTDSVIDVRSCALIPPKSNAPNRIIYNTDPNGLKQFFELSGNTLKLMVGCIPLDGAISTYRRIASDTE